jgi:hypothetical protein
MDSLTDQATDKLVTFLLMGVMDDTTWGVKRPGREDDRSPPSSVEVKNAKSLPPPPNTSSRRGAQLSKTYILMAWCLIKHRDFIYYHGIHDS